MAGRLQCLFLAEIESRRVVTVTGPVQFLDDILRQFVGVAVRVLQVQIQSAAVGTGDRCHIVKSLGAPLDLEGIHTGLADQIKERCRAQVIGVENIAAVLAFTDFHILAGAMFLHQRILPAAGLCAFTAVAAAARHITGQQAAARHAHAHGTVHKGFQFQVRRAVVPDLRDFGQRQFPGQHHTLCPQFIADPGRLVVGNARLCGHMAFHPGCIFLGQRQHPQVGNDERIHTGFGGILNILRQLFQFFIGG